MPLSMPYVLLGLFIIGVTVSSNVGAEVDSSQELAVDDLKDLLMTSIQNTISVNELVTQLTQKIVNVMITVGETETKLEELEKTFKKEIESVRAEIEGNNESLNDQLESLKNNSESGLLSLNGKVESLKNNSESGLLSLNGKVESLKNNSESGLLSLNGKVESLKNNSETKNQKFEQEIETLEEKVGTLDERSNTNQESIQTLKGDVNTRNKEAIVVSAEDGVLRDPNCVKVCGGTTRRGATNWSGSGSYPYTTVDISDCGFVTVPTVTTSIEGSGIHNRLTGTSAVYDLSTSSFMIYLKYPLSSGYSHSKTYHWNVEWIAIGYTC